MLRKGITKSGIHYAAVLACFVCDAPARAFIKNIMGHSGYFGCDKCSQEGEYVEGKVTFPEMDAQLRTDIQFDEIVMRTTIVAQHH